MLSSISKLNRTAKEIMTNNFDSERLAHCIYNCSVSQTIFSALPSQLYDLLAQSGGKSATEYAQTKVRQPKKEEALPLLSTEQPDI